MEKIKSTINLLKTMLCTSYDTSYLIDGETKKLNKKSPRLWLIIGVALIVAYLSNFIVGKLTEIGLEEVFLQLFFIVLQILVIFQTILLGINVIYCSDDIGNYLHLPISNTKLLFTKFSVMMSIIFGTELIIVIPSLYIYGTHVIDNILIYSLLMILVLFLISIFLSSVCIIIMIPIMRICRFIKNKYWYQSIVILIMTSIMLLPITKFLYSQNNNEFIQEQESQDYYEIQTENEDEKQLTLIKERTQKINKSFIVGELGVQVLSESNFNSIVNLLRILGLNIIGLTILLVIGRKTYINDILWIASIFKKKKKHKIKLKKKCKEKKKKRAYVINDIKDILKNSTFFMYYIYNVLIIVVVIVVFAILIIPIIKQAIIENLDKTSLEALSFDFEIFSIIIGIIQIIYMISPISLTAISRYGKNSIFFKYIPIKPKIQFRLKNIPQILMNTLVSIIILLTIYYLFPEIKGIYILAMFITTMLLNIIYSYILLLIDLKRPELNSESEISIIQQNDNKMFKYIITAIIGVILWYIYQVTKELDLNIAIMIEIGVFSFIIGILEIIINKKKDKLLKNIY